MPIYGRCPRIRVPNDQSTLAAPVVRCHIVNHHCKIGGIHDDDVSASAPLPCFLEIASRWFMYDERRVESAHSWVAGGYDGGMAARVLHLEGFEGKAVAVDQDTDEVVASADTPQELLRIIRERGLRNTMILRAPRVDEPLRVGLG